MHIKYFGFILACLMLHSSITLAIIVPYFKPMLLGRTFDYSKSKVGTGIFPASARNNPVTTQHSKTDIKFKMIRSAKDVRSVLAVSGQLSLQIMSGLLDIKGKGSYLKESFESNTFIEVLASIEVQTVTKTITDQQKPIPGWDNKPNIIGKHYVRSISYGGFLIASLKFSAKNEKNKQEIQASVNANLKTGSAQVGIEGQFNSLASAVKDISTLTISYTATAPLTTVPKDIKSLLKAIDEFPNAIKSIKGGIGVPIEAEIFPLSQLSGNKKLEFSINGAMKTKLSDIETYYYDLRTTLDAIKKFLKRNPLLSKGDENKLGVFYDKVFSITGVFNTMIASINLNSKSINQFQKATDAYQNGGSKLPGKFFRQLNALIVTINPIKTKPPALLAYFKGNKLYLRANKKSTAVAQEKEVKSLFDRLEKKFNALSQKSVTCFNADWWSSFDKKGWSVCAGDEYFINGFFRSANNGKDDKIALLESAQCCSASTPYAGYPGVCVHANWWNSLDKKNSWSKCPKGYFLNGLYRSEGKNLHRIEDGNCCKPANHPKRYGGCYDEDVGRSFDNKGWSKCKKSGYFVVGLYRSGGDLLYNIEKFKCCKMV